MDYATVQDVVTLFRPLQPDETQKAADLIPVVCARLRQEAERLGKNLDIMIGDNANLAMVAKSVTVDIVARCLMTPTTGAPMSQYSESALGYSVSGTFLNPGGGLFIKKSELDALGLRRQKYGVIDFYGND